LSDLLGLVAVGKEADACERLVIGSATLYLADCREVLPTLERHDLLLTDPPYGIGANRMKPPHRQAQTGAGRRRAGMPRRRRGLMLLDMAVDTCEAA
jgi:hypothetical protein